MSVMKLGAIVNKDDCGKVTLENAQKDNINAYPLT